jgi:S-adenosylmethionine decarboxylase
MNGYDCDPKKLADLDLVYQFLDCCSDLIEMTRSMGKPYVFKHRGKVPEVWGVSGFILGRPLAQISIHTFPEKRYLLLNIFSIEDFAYSKAITYAAEVFDIARYEHHILNRVRKSEEEPPSTPDEAA